jgi:endonuclease/exonuclease/phosphatase family metal-dependent hydrolase
MPESKAAFEFLWWNVDSFAHFDAARAGEPQWPPELAAYQAKCDRVDLALRGLIVPRCPDVLALAEVTNRAATELRNRLLPGYVVHSLDLLPRAELQIALVYNPAVASNPNYLDVPGVPPSTRPIACLDVCWTNHQLRIYACHWAARFRQASEDTRRDVAKYLNAMLYDFMRAASAGEQRHVLIVGDFNEEPFGLLETRFHASRDRTSARRREHYTDQHVKRLRLYNSAWRWLGEHRPHSGGAFTGEIAGTYYWRKERCWRTFDQVMVDGTLLTQETPYLDEAQLEVLTSPALLGESQRPQKFRWNQGKPEGVSDHLPVRGRIILTREGSHE